MVVIGIILLVALAVLGWMLAMDYRKRCKYFALHHVRLLEKQLFWRDRARKAEAELEMLKRKVEYDKDTLKWFEAHPFAQITAVKCEACGLYYKPALGHRCKKEKKEH